MRSALVAAAAPLRDLGGWLEEHLIWRLADLLRGSGEALRWPFEQLAWLVERRLLWPLQERTAGHVPRGRAAGAGALATVALATVAIGALSISAEENGVERAPAPARVAVAPAPAPQPPPEAPQRPSLEGVPPSFGTGGVAAKPQAAADGGESPSASTETADAEAEATDDPTDAEAGAVTSSSRKPVPAGPVAMRAARRFAEAFVFYEVGQRPQRAKTVFEETATPRLAGALAERPPRQPAAAQVPKARVLNLVPGPRRGKVYTVSAALLRVGVTSELRLKLTKRSGAWLVTDVRG